MKLKCTKKLIALFCVGVIGVMGLTGCSSQSEPTNVETSDTSSNNVTSVDNNDEETSNGQETNNGEETSNGELESETRIISTSKGDIEVPSNPKRIVIQAYIGDILSVGVKPIAGDMSIELFDDLLLEDEYTMVTDFEGETIMALEPDLIIIMENSTASDYDKLSRIAPTITLDDLSMTTTERVMYIGKIVGKEAEAKKAVADYEKLAVDSKQRLVDSGIIDKTITVIEGNYIFGEKYGRGADIVYNYLGFRAPDILQEKFDAGEFYAEVSMEVMPEYCGDYILRSVWDGVEDLSDNSVWLSIDAVNNGNVIEIDFEQFFARDIYVMSKQMVHITDALLASLD